jgi:putative ABC transport system permease protein
MRFLQDLRFATRVVAKNPSYTLIAAAVLALGIGANTAIFSVIDALVLRPVHFENLDRLVSVMETEPQQVGPWNELAPANYVDYKERSRSFDQFAVARVIDFNLATGGPPEVVLGARVTEDFFDALSIRADIGRVPSRDELKEGADGRVVLLSHSLWVQRFASNPSVVGSEVRMNGENFIVTGVAPKNLRFPVEAQLWTPLNLTPAIKQDRNSFVLFGVGLLKPGVTVEAAQAEMQTLAKQLEAEHPDTNTGRGTRILPLSRFLAGPARDFMLMQLGAVGFVLLIACANVANLQLAQAAGRRKERAVRFALGASRWRVFQQSLTESLVVALLGAGLGLVVAYWGIDLIRSGMPASVMRFVPGWENISLDVRALMYTMGAAVFAAVLAGVLPALRASKPDLQSTLRETPSSTGSAHRLRNVLVAGEVALAMVLLVGAIMMTDGFWKMMRSGEQHAPQSLLTFRLTSPRPADEAGWDRIGQMHDQIRQRLTELPGVSGVAATSLMPYSGRNTDRPVEIEGEPPRARSELPVARSQSTLPDYFRVFRVPLVKGRVLNEQDGRESQRVAVVSAAFVRKYLREREPIGVRIKVDDETWTIVGVVGDVIHHWFIDQDPIPTLYRAHLQYPDRSMDFALRTAGDPLALVPGVQNVVQSFDRELPLADVKTLDRGIHEHYTGLRYSAYLMTAFSVLALVLSCLGVYAVISYVVAERTHEIGIRMALGASARQVSGAVVRQSVLVMTAGLMVGIVGAIGLARLLSHLIFGVSAADLAPYLLASGLFLIVGIGAAWFPARRAMRVDPLIALRQL